MLLDHNKAQASEDHVSSSMKSKLVEDGKVMKNVYSNIAIDSSNSQTNFSNFNSMKILKPLDHATISSRDCGSSSAITGQHSH